MEYGKPFGIASTGTTTLVGFTLGYGWIVVGALSLTSLSVLAIRLYFRKNKMLGQ